MSGFDLEPTLAGSKSRSAQSPAVAEVCYSLVQSTGGAGSETTRVCHAARRRGSNVAARGAGAAAGGGTARLFYDIFNSLN